MTLMLKHEEYKRMSQAEGKYMDEGEEGTVYRKILSQGSAWNSQGFSAHVMKEHEFVDSGLRMEWTRLNKVKGVMQQLGFSLRW